eukprot:scaffold2911_cov177-Amphora_coffeaeformis.AAC.1
MEEASGMDKSRSILLPGFPLAPGQTEPEVLCINGLRHVEPYYVLVSLSLFGDKKKNSKVTTTVGKCLELLQSEHRRMNPPIHWWIRQLNRGKLFANKSLTEPPVDNDTSIRGGDCVWSIFHYHEQAIPFDKDIELDLSTTTAAAAAAQSEHYIVVNKPAGVDVLCNPAAGRVRNSLPGLFAASKNTLLLPAHRLDSPVSGLVCCGRTNSDIKRLSRRIALGESNKRYLARVDNSSWESLDNLPLTIDQPVAFDSSRSIAYVDSVKGKRAVTVVEKCLQKNHVDGTALVQIRLETGRKHQIRIHLQTCGMPIANDERYGGTQSQPHISAFGLPDPPRALKALYEKRFDEHCEDCVFVLSLLAGKRGLGPSVNQGIWLHCWRYEFPTLGLEFESPLPSWVVVRA